MYLQEGFKVEQQFLSPVCCHDMDKGASGGGRGERGELFSEGDID